MKDQVNDVSKDENDCNELSNPEDFRHLIDLAHDVHGGPAQNTREDGLDHDKGQNVMLEVFDTLFDLFAILRIAILGNQVIQQECQFQSHKDFKHASPCGKQALIVISETHIGIECFSIANGISEF